MKSLYTDNGRVSGLYLQDGSLHRGDAVIVATGGLSYPSTGSDGDGYRFAGECGHQVTELAPSLVPPAHEGGVYPQNAGTFPEKCHTDRKKTEKDSLSGFRRNDVHTFRYHRPSGPLRKRPYRRRLKKTGRTSGFHRSENRPLRKNSLTRGSSENLRPEKTNSLKM